MQTALAPQRPLPEGLSAPVAFLHLYCVAMPLRIVRGYRAYALAFLEVFAFVFLLKTLFAPWKHITDPYPKKGFNLAKIAETFTLNCTARCIGFVIRFATIAIGIVVECACLVAAMAVLAGWFLIGIPYSLFEISTERKRNRDGVARMLAPDLLHSVRGKQPWSAETLLDAACSSNSGRFFLREMGSDPEQFASRCHAELGKTMDAASLLSAAQALARTHGEETISGPMILAVVCEQLQEGQAILRECDLAHDDLESLIRWEQCRRTLLKKSFFWTPEALAHNCRLGRSWVMGYTDQLDRLTTDIAEHGSLDGERKIVIHQDRIDAMLHVASRSTQRNMLVLGKVGVGKETLVENFAAALRAAERSKHLPFTRVLQLQTQDLLSGQSSPDAFLLSALNRAQSSGHFILVIRDIALFLSSGSENLRGVLMKFLEAKNIAIIGIADTQDYHAHIKTNPLLDSLFEKIDVPDTSDEDTMTVLMGHTLVAEEKGIAVTYKALRAALDLSKRYLAGKGGFPGTARDVLDDAVLRASERGDRTVLEEHVRDVISLRGKVNVGKVTSDERERLLHLESTLCAKVIGQDGAMKALSSALKRSRADVSDRKKPIGTFLFLGPTGVGKTQTAKILAEQYFGSADAMVRLDMNEYSHADSVVTLSNDGYLTQRVQDKPFSLVLLDEIEKAHPSVLNLFLQILDEGIMTDSKGMRTDFRNTIIIATSNAGALHLREAGATKATLIDAILRDKLFSPEFLNRFDEIILFSALTQQDAQKVAILMIDDIVRDVQNRRGITVQIDADVLAQLLERGYSAEFGAREMRRTITGIIEDYLADYLLRHEVQRGDTIQIRAADIKW